MKTIFQNTAFEPIQKYVKEHGGFDSKGLTTEAGQKYLAAMEEIRLFNDKKVIVTFNAENDFISVNGGTKKGKIRIVEGRIRFYEGRKTTHFYYLDAGLYLGWFATLIPTKIETIS